VAEYRWRTLVEKLPRCDCGRLATIELTVELEDDGIDSFFSCNLCTTSNHVYGSQRIAWADDVEEYEQQSKCARCGAACGAIWGKCPSIL
jgi:hypothetical protein